MLTEVDIKSGLRLEDYAENALLAAPVAELRTEARAAAARLAGRTVWMVNSTARGGGVAEMLPKQVALLRELGVQTRWLVINTDKPAFFELTKRIHNLIHSAPALHLSAGDRELYEAVSQPLAQELAPLLQPRDIVIAHDPQPAGVLAFVKRVLPIKVVWRCHIGLEVETAATHNAWSFLKPYLQTFDHSVFSSSAYIPHFLSKHVSIIHPAIDPLTHKNRELHPVKLAGVLTNAGLLKTGHPVLTPNFQHPVERLTPQGEFRALDAALDIGLMLRPTVTQVSRWDHLKGWAPLLEGFVHMKQRLTDGAYQLPARARRRLEIVRLILAGPHPDSVVDDPEAVGVLNELIEQYRALPPALQKDVAVLSLPMSSTKENALMVNALQRCSSVVAQNSIQEGFGLVVTEAMWKRTPVLASSAHGIRQQIRDRMDGVLIGEASSPESVEAGLLTVLEDPNQRATWARRAQRRVFDEFLIFRQLGHWLRLLERVATHP